MSERWKLSKLTGYCYEVSSYGNIRRAKPGPATYIGKPVKIHTNRDGYSYVVLSANSKQIWIYVHTLVAYAFIGPCPEGKEVNHKDLDKENNYYKNLEYLTHQENIDHCIASGTPVGGYTKKFDTHEAHKIRRLYRKGKYNQQELADKYNVHYSVISRVINKKKWYK
jgi:hypothetical protein